MLHCTDIIVGLFSTLQKIAQRKRPHNELFDAVESGNGDAVRRLLAAGADIHSRDGAQRTPLILAAMHGHTDLVRFLLERGAHANDSDKTGCTALMMAAMFNGNVDIVNMLLAAGADMEAADMEAADICGETALMRAAGSASHTSTLSTLLALGAIGPFDVRGEVAQALAAAQSEKHLDMARALLHAGANVNARDANGRTALNHALHYETADDAGNSAMVRLLEFAVFNGSFFLLINNSGSKSK